MRLSLYGHCDRTFDVEDDMVVNVSSVANEQITMTVHVTAERLNGDHHTFLFHACHSLKSITSFMTRPESPISAYTGYTPSP